MDMQIKILGKGCSKCKVTYLQVQKVLKELDFEIDVIKVEDIDEILKFNILSTPGFVINDELKIAGRIPSTKEIKTLILENINKGDLKNDY
jgi:small redox-active disulfide protein 2